MPAVSIVGDHAYCPADAHSCPACPHPVMGPATAGSPDLLINGKPVLRIGDPGKHMGCCGPNLWIVAEGSSSVSVNNLPVARVGDATLHCGGKGVLVQGSSNVIIGGEPVSLGVASVRQLSGLFGPMAAQAGANVGSLLGAVASVMQPVAGPTALELARKELGSTEWTLTKVHKYGDFGYPKCNLFVYDMLSKTGQAPPLLERDPIAPWKDNVLYPPLAKHWGDPDFDIPGWTVVTDPQPGDVASNGKHMGFVSDVGKTISASSIEHKVVENDWGFKSDEPTPIFRRYTGD